MGASHSRNAREHERGMSFPRTNGRRTRDDEEPMRPDESTHDERPATQRRRLSLGNAFRMRRGTREPTPETRADGVPHPDPLESERRDATRLIERVLGRPPPTTSHPPHPPLDPERLRGTHRSVPHFVPPPQNARHSTLGTILSEVLGATSRAQPAARPEPQSGTSVIVQGALVARTAQHRGESTGPQPDGTPQAATLQEQGEMLGCILRIATAATAASLVSMSNGAQPPPAAQTPPRAQNTDTHRPTAAPVDGTGAVPPSSRRSAELFERLNNLSDRLRASHEPREQESMTMISRLMREALRNVLLGGGGDSSERSSERARETQPQPQPQAQPQPQPQPSTTEQSVLHTLENARQGRPLSDGAPGSFERFLHDLIVDLGVAVQRMRQPNEVHDENDAVRERRGGDISAGELSFFRIFRFERTREALVPCVLVGVRSLRAGERLMGSDDDGAQAGGAAPAQPEPAAEPAAQSATEPSEPSSAAPGASQPTSRFILFVSGGRYHDEHPLLTAHPRDAGRDLMFMMELLGTMAAMSSKPPTASASDIANSGLRKVQASEIAALIAAGEITENAREQCLVCLDEWQQDDEVRILACHHAFHAACVDRWLEHSSNTCPLCTFCFANQAAQKLCVRAPAALPSDRVHTCHIAHRSAHILLTWTRAPQTAPHGGSAYGDIRAQVACTVSQIAACSSVACPPRRTAQTAATAPQSPLHASHIRMRCTAARRHAQDTGTRHARGAAPHSSHALCDIHPASISAMSPCPVRCDTVAHISTRCSRRPRGARSHAPPAGAHAPAQ